MCIKFEQSNTFSLNVSNATELLYERRTKNDPAIVFHNSSIALLDLIVWQEPRSKGGGGDVLPHSFKIKKS